MKTRIGSKGSCLACTLEFPRAEAAKHLALCGAEPTAPARLLIEADGGEPYWLFLVAHPEATFKQLDAALRAAWLECCGHMSAFSAGAGRISMSARLSDRLGPGVAIRYEYDFGSTTELSLRVVSTPSLRLKSKVALVARNVAPSHSCTACGGAATGICGECGCGDIAEGAVCDTCVGSHECGEDMILPLVNSPRTGVCGYTG